MRLFRKNLQKKLSAAIFEIIFTYGIENGFYVRQKCCAESFFQGVKNLLTHVHHLSLLTLILHVKEFYGGREYLN